MDEKVKAFLHFVAREVMDEDFEKNAGSFAELSCRRLVDLGIMSEVEKEDGKYYEYIDPDVEEEEETAEEATPEEESQNE